MDFAWVKEFIHKVAALLKNHVLLRGLAVLLLVLIIVEVAGNLWLRGAISQAVTGAGEDVRIEVKVAWVGLGDLCRGRLGSVKLEGTNCQLSGLEYQSIFIDSQGLDLDLSRYIQDKVLMIEAIKATSVTGIITAAALSTYLTQNYPDFKPQVTLSPEQLSLSGVVDLFGKQTGIRLQGKLETYGVKTLRFYPERLLIGEREVPSSVLDFIGTQLPLVFEVMSDWPLQISRLSLQEQSLEIGFRELTQ